MLYDPKTDYYSTLGVADGATSDEIKRAYREKVKLVHPDGHRTPELATRATQQLNDAYAVLSAPAKRRVYDEQRAAHWLRENEPEIRRRVAAEVAKMKRMPARTAKSRVAAAPQRVDKKVQQVRERVQKTRTRAQSRALSPLGLVPKKQQGTFMHLVEPKIDGLYRENRTFEAVLLGVGAAMLDGWLATPRRKR